MTNNDEKKPMTEEETTELLIECGIEMSDSWLMNAVTTADNIKQMTNQITVLEVACTMTLGNIIANEAHQSEKPIEEVLKTYFENIERGANHVLKHIKSGDAEKFFPQNETKNNEPQRGIQ